MDIKKQKKQHLTRGRSGGRTLMVVLSLNKTEPDVKLCSYKTECNALVFIAVVVTASSANQYVATCTHSHQPLLSDFLIMNSSDKLLEELA